MEGRALRVRVADPVERELRRQRPIARGEYVSAAVASVSRPSRTASWRIALAGVVSLLIVGSFLALGGLADLAAPTRSFVTFAKNVVSEPKKERTIVRDTPADDQFSPRT